MRQPPDPAPEESGMWEWMLRLERDVRADWEAAGKAPEAFPSICRRHLAAAEPGTDRETFLHELLRLDYPGEQGYPGAEFGDAAITVARNADFRIDVYLWNGGRDTSIHDHHFTGAYRPVYGWSRQHSFAFEPEADCDDRLTKGALHHCETRSIAGGEAAEIPLGERLIHLVEHVGDPTITVCVRVDDLEGRHLNEYFFPGYRLCLRGGMRAGGMKKLRLLLVMAKAKAADWKARIEPFVRSLSASERFFLVTQGNRLMSTVPDAVRAEFNVAVRDCVERDDPEWLSVTPEHKRMLRRLMPEPARRDSAFTRLLAQARPRGTAAALAGPG